VAYAGIHSTIVWLWLPYIYRSKIPGKKIERLSIHKMSFIIPHIKPQSSSILIFGYLALSTTLPFALSYRESLGGDTGLKGTINARSLFNKI
jgi:hypothetical protein